MVEPHRKKYTMIDLFAGTGAFTYAFKEYGDVEVVYANDFCSESEDIYNINNDHELINKDFNTLDVGEIPPHNILTAGFSCQPFSQAGKQKGFEDERSNVFWKILEVLECHEPEIVVLENVKNLCTHDKGNTLKIITENIERLGYTIKYKILDTCKITDIPQHRERIYIICFKDPDLCDNFEFDFPEIENREIIDLLEIDVPEKYYYTDRLKVYDKVVEGVTEHISEGILYQFRRHYVRENKSGVCPTLTANMGSGGHNVPLLMDDYGIRKLTPRECFNFQGFPIDYKLPDLCDSKLYKLAGNAVSIPVVKLIVQKLFSLIH